MSSSAAYPSNVGVLADPQPSAEVDSGIANDAEKQIDPEFIAEAGLLSIYRRAGARMHFASWAWSLMPMTTLGLSTLLSAQRSIHDFQGLYALGLIVYFIGLLQWLLVLAIKITRFLAVKGAFQHTLSRPSEAMFHAAFWIGVYGIITGATDFAAPEPGSRLATTFLVFFWIFLVFAICVGVSLHLLLFHGHELHSRDFTPAWLLPVLPIILTGVMAGAVAEITTSKQRMPVLIAGLVCSSMGFLLSIPIAGIYFYRLYTSGFPEPDSRPGMMIAVGPPTYAPLAWLKLSAAIPKDYAMFAALPQAQPAMEVLAFVFGFAVLGMGLFFFLMAFCAIVRRANEMKFHLTWYGFIFPNVGLLSTLGILGLKVPSEGIGWTVSGCTAALVGVWLFVTVTHLRAMCRGASF